MSTSSIDTYIRSLVIEAIRLETKDIRISRTGNGFRIEMLIENSYETFPHPPVKETVDLMGRLRELSNVPPTTNGHSQEGEFRITRRGEELVMKVTFRKDAGTETADVKLL